MAALGTWRNLRSLMMLTVQVAAIATSIRYFRDPSPRPSSFLSWLSFLAAVASLSILPYIQWILAEPELQGHQIDPTCPRCQRSDLRPQLTPGVGIFQPVSRYRCAGCWTTIRLEGDVAVIESIASTSEIKFLDEPSTDTEIRFLDEPAKTAD